MSLKEDDSAFKPKAFKIFSGNTTAFQEFSDDFQDVAQTMQILHLFSDADETNKPLLCPELPEKPTAGLLETYRQEMGEFKKQEKSISVIRQMYKTPDNRPSFGIHGELGFYVGPAKDHDKCILVWIIKTGAQHNA